MVRPITREEFDAVTEEVWRLLGYQNHDSRQIPQIEASDLGAYLTLARVKQREIEYYYAGYNDRDVDAWDRRNSYSGVKLMIHELMCIYLRAIVTSPDNPPGTEDIIR